MSSINKVIILGNVGKDAEVKSFPSGDLYMQFSVATSESWKSKEGEWREYPMAQCQDPELGQGQVCNGSDCQGNQGLYRRASRVS